MDFVKLPLPNLIHLHEHEATNYLDFVYDAFKRELADKGSITFLGLPVTCPYHPATDGKHFSFWHAASADKYKKGEEEREPDIRRCERMLWIPYVIENCADKGAIWCWEKSVRTKRGKSQHVMLYLHQQEYLVVLRRKPARFELVTAYVKPMNQGVVKDNANHPDPRG